MLAPSRLLPRRSRLAALRSLVVPAGILTIIALVILLVPVLPLADPDVQDVDALLAPLGTHGHVLGTDALGRDLLSRLIHGARVSLCVGLIAVAVAATLGGVVGIIIGYGGKKVDTVVVIVMDVLLAFPPLILALVIAAFLGISVRNVVIALIFSSLPGYVRFARAETVRIRGLNFVKIAQLNGAKRRDVLAHHIAPNVVGPIATYALTMLGIAILVEAALSFLGLGVRPPQASLGIVIAEGKLYLADAPQLVAIPGALLCLVIVSLNLLSDRLIALRQRGS